MSKARSIPSRANSREKTKRSKGFSGKDRGKRLGQVAELVDVVPFVKWLYFDGLLTLKESQSLTGIGRQTIRELISMTDSDKPLAFCERSGCYRRLSKARPDCKLCRPKEPGKHALSIKPCLRFKVCGKNVLKTSETGLCGRCRETLPHRLKDRHARAVQLKELRAAGIAPPVQPAAFCAFEGCSAKLKYNNTSGFCKWHKPKKNSLATRKLKN